jgi:hypothetical protein
VAVGGNTEKKNPAEMRIAESGQRLAIIPVYAEYRVQPCLPQHVGAAMARKSLFFVGAALWSPTEKPPGVGGFWFAWGSFLSRLLLHLYGDGFGELEAECGLYGQDNLLLSRVGRSRGPRTRTGGRPDEGAFSATG